MHNGLDHAEARFRLAIQAAGLPAPETIHADGKIHRFGTSGKYGDNSGWYVLHADGMAAGAFGCWRSGLSQDWCAESPERMPVAQREAYRQRMEAVRAAREQERAGHHQRAAEAARALLARSKPGDHPYLTAKGIAAHGMRVDGEHLLIPMRDASGELHNVQRIAPDGQKRFLSGGRVKGCYCAVGKLTDSLVVCEGVATGASIHEATGLAVAVSFTAGNLLPVAEALRQKYQTLTIVIAADDDYRTEGNPGITKAREAAAAVGGKVAVPVFPKSSGERDTDFNDLHRVAGLGAIKACFERLEKVGQQADGSAQYATEVRLIRGHEVEMRPIPWLWDGYIAEGRLTILAGRPGTGKTTVALALAATVTLGGRWPDGTRVEAGNVAVWSGEDDPSDTLAPRLALAGADMTRVLFVDEVIRLGERRAFDPATDMDALRRALTEAGGCRLLIVDPVVSAIAGDSHKNAEVRRSLAPLCDLANQIGCAVLGITHLSKGTEGRDPTERVVGSMAFGALARTVLMAAKSKDADGKTKRLLVRSKNNLGDDTGGFEYDIQQGEVQGALGVFSSRVMWGDPIEGDARELLAGAEATTDPDDPQGDARAFLTDLLREGPVPTKTVKADAEGAGYSWATIRRAQKALGIEAHKAGMKSGWVWQLPPTDSPKVLTKMTKVLSLREEHLRGNLSTFEGDETPGEHGDDRIEVEV